MSDDGLRESWKVPKPTEEELEQYCSRIQETHRSRNMDGYRQAINGYVSPAREACRMKKKQESVRRSGA